MRKPSVLIIFLTVFIDLIGFGIVIPLLPIYAKNFHAAGWEIGGPGPLIYVFSPSGEVLETHPVPCTRPTNCAFGGEDLTDLYVTTIEGFLFRAQTDRVGRPLYRGALRK